MRWSAIEHIVANCLKVMLGLCERQAIMMVFPLNMEEKLNRINDLSKITSLNSDAQRAIRELVKVGKALNFVRNSTIHAIVREDGGYAFELRSKKRFLPKKDVLSTEEFTNYVGHVVIFLRHALGEKDTVGGPPRWPTRPEIPAFLKSKIQ
jgi:predicted transcriptional regulator